MLHGQILAAEEASKYLGNRTLGFIKRNLRECTIPVKAASYTTLVCPVLEYTSAIWDLPAQ